MEGTMEETANELTKAEKKYQIDKEKYALYQIVYVGQLSNEEESDAESDYSECNYVN